MDANQIVQALQSGYIFVHCSFWQYQTESWADKIYAYKALKSQNIAIGDQVIVDTPRGEPKVVIVRAVDEFPEFDPNIKYKWIIQRLDRTQYEVLLTNETELTKRVKSLLRENTRKQFLANFGTQLDSLANKDELLKELQQQANFAPLVGFEEGSGGGGGTI